MKFKFVMTCMACPEQYDAFLDGEMVGYLRLRHGTFRVECPDVGKCEVLRTSECQGDGIFELHERQIFLQRAANAIQKWIQDGKPAAYETTVLPEAEFYVEGEISDDY